MKQDIHPKMYMYKRIVDAKVFIDTQYMQKIDLQNISGQANFSKYHFLRLFKSAFGQSPHQYLIEVRLTAAKNLLKQGQQVKEVCYAVGFESVPSFIALFKKREGLTPNDYLKEQDKLKKEQATRPLSFVPSCFAQQFDWEE